ncbi:MAG: hypothetical protein U9N86_10190 [Bacteroidota bacterium]|nr:hypothetical protein [Bacteroidota bacterium]
MRILTDDSGMKAGRKGMLGIGYADVEAPLKEEARLNALIAENLGKVKIK